MLKNYDEVISSIKTAKTEREVIQAIKTALPSEQLDLYLSSVLNATTFADQIDNLAKTGQMIKGSTTRFRK
jgi:hypothetical protein